MIVPIINLLLTCSAVQLFRLLRPASADFISHQFVRPFGSPSLSSAVASAVRPYRPSVPVSWFVRLIDPSAGTLIFNPSVQPIDPTTGIFVCDGPALHTSQAYLPFHPALSGSIIPRKFNSDEKKKKDNLSRTKRKNTRKNSGEAAIAYFARADAAAAIEAAAAEVATIEAADVTEEPAEDAAVALVIGIADQHSRPRLQDFVPPPTSRRVLYRPYDRWPSPEEPPTPPGEPESEEEEFIPNLSDCEVRSEVGPSSDDEAPEPTSPPPPAPPSPVEWCKLGTPKPIRRVAST
ncbi:LOW QUALITY PROTEIN: hypothetical protein DAPPUDRAFT_250974 [Daphnia pulex]|uniref:Uncharacterized protein n=1 Tax=Daphnia pulex TaxID=6669 RepID=E9GZI9_DAPPU|nr:LOW QUALITY PROTEIN: hypothetical protein DAPPUDRAFT_250974 [Daphnia pulex]|eukprot:EFX75095.1 LOW QUALITY PROTEIN: hypothetical protein DAPPUDRAFT_250974 [Daphnia pulex]